MTNAPPTRKTHVIRILGTNKNGDVLSDIWADVERIDEARTVYQTADVNWQGSVRRLKWQDDPDSDSFAPDGPRSRKTRIVKVCSPDEPNQDDPSEWIPIPVIDRMRSSISDQNDVRSFVNGEGGHARAVEARRILHYDTSIDDDAQAAFDADPTRKVYVVSGDRYSRKDDTKDDSQWIEHEIVTYLKNRTTGQSKTGVGDDQSKQTKLLNQYLIDESEPAKLEIVGTNGINPPWRLDPYQNIVNINLGGTTQLDVYPDTERVRISGIVGPGDATKITISALVQLVVNPARKRDPYVGTWRDTSFGDQIGVISFQYFDPFNVVPATVFGWGIEQGGSMGFLANSYKQQSYPNTFLIESGDDGGTPIVSPVGGSNLLYSTNGPLVDVDLSDGQFHHVMFAADLSTASVSGFVPPLGGDNPFSVFAGTFESGPTLVGATDGMVCQAFPTFLPGRGIDSIYGPELFPDNKVWATSNFMTVGTPWPFPTSGLSSWSSSSDGSGHDYTASLQIPPVVLELGKAEAMLGSYEGYGSSDPLFSIVISNLMVWVDKFIDPRIHAGDFVQQRDPQIFTQPAAIIEQFGMPYIWCDGTPDRFIKNRGTGPNFTNRLGFIQPFAKRPRFA
jgi:hypothetical protein